MIYFNMICFIATAAAFIACRNYRRADIEAVWKEEKQSGLRTGLPLLLCDSYRKMAGHNSRKGAGKPGIKAQLLKLMPLCSIGEAEEKFYTGMIRIFLGGWMLVHFMAIIFNVTVSDTAPYENGSLKRPDAGAQPYTVRLDMDNEVTGKSQFDITVSPRIYTEEERRDAFKSAEAYVLDTALGENKAWDDVRKPLNFIRTVPGAGISVEWELQDYTLIDDDGNIIGAKINDDGESTVVTAKLVYEGVSESLDIPVTVYPPLLTEKEQLIKAVEEKLTAMDTDGRSKPDFLLPDSANGYGLAWSVPEKNTAAAVTLIGISAAFICAAGRISNLNKRLKDREQQLILDYPDFVYKLILLNGAGMSLKASVETMLGDAKVAGKDRRYVWQEMQAALRAMAQGVSEIQAYELFGQRCAQLPYLKLSSLMVQSLKKGVGGIGHMMSDAADEAVMMKRDAAVRAGEAVGTKLLMPMGMLLAVVLIILVVPAFMTMNM